MEWLTNNWGAIAIGLSFAINGFCAVAAVTKTKKDDKVAGWIKAAAKRFLSLG